MNIFKNLRVVILIVAPILILALIRSVSSYHFKNDVKKWAEPSVMRSNVISAEKVSSLKGEILLINLDSVIKTQPINASSLNIKSDSVLVKKNFNLIRKHHGPVLLSSYEIAVSARIWMVLSQMGIQNVYILAKDIDNEVFKNKFRPDTIIRPEL
jgi:hypothetical protein